MKRSQWPSIFFNWSGKPLTPLISFKGCASLSYNKFGKRTGHSVLFLHVLFISNVEPFNCYTNNY